MVTPPTPPGQPVIPLVADADVDRGASMGTLVADAAKQLSILVRAEVELAKLEVTTSIKHGLRGAVWFIVALVIVLFSLFFGWLAVGEILSIWLPRWAAFTIVFGLMLLAAGFAGYRGYRRVKKISKPEQTIASLQDTGKTLAEAGACPRGQNESYRPRHREGAVGSEARQPSPARGHERPATAGRGKSNGP